MRNQGTGSAGRVREPQRGMKLVLVAVGKPTGSLRPAILDYEERVSRYFGFESVEVGAAKGTVSEIRAEEGERLRSRISKETRVYAVTRSGDRCSSLDLATQFEDLATYGPGAATFVIGGAFGLGEAVLERADRRIALYGP